MGSIFGFATDEAIKDTVESLSIDNLPQYEVKEGYDYKSLSCEQKRYIDALVEMYDKLKGFNGVETPDSIDYCSNTLERIEYEIRNSMSLEFLYEIKSYIDNRIVEFCDENYCVDCANREYCSNCQIHDFGGLK